MEKVSGCSVRKRKVKGLFSSAGLLNERGHVNELLFHEVKQIVWVEAGSILGAKTRQIWQH